MVGEIAAASNEQARGIEEINKAVAEMDKVVQQNSANAEESSSASEEMSAQAWQMRDYVKDLMVLLGGKKVDGLLSAETLRMESKDQVSTTDSSHSQGGGRMKSAWSDFPWPDSWGKPFWPGRHRKQRLSRRLGGVVGSTMKQGGNGFNTLRRGE